MINERLDFNLTEKSSQRQPTAPYAGSVVEAVNRCRRQHKDHPIQLLVRTLQLLIKRIDLLVR